MSSDDMTDSELPRWARDLHQSLAVNTQFVLWGNIRDSFLVVGPDGPAFLSLLDVAWQVLGASGHRCILVHDPVEGVRVHPDTDEARSAAAALLVGSVREGGGPLGLPELAGLLERVVSHREARVALVVDYASRLTRDVDDLSDDERTFFTRAQRASHVAVPLVAGDRRPTPLYNPVLWLLEEERDLPHWFAGSNSAVRVLPVPEPHLGQRRAAARQLVGSLRPAVAAGDVDEVVETFAATTHGMAISELVEVIRLAHDAGLGGDRIGDAVRAFKVGVLDDPWTRPDLRERVSTGEQEIRADLLGQEVAITRAFDILKRTVMGMSGAQAVRSGRPRGVLFFAGPTGVGKTELARRITRLVFGAEEAYLRFDMSEFAQEHAEARLIGAPPGYIGHDAGGELTRAIREQPFRLVLFDEIEKAHDRILDKFLQILDDGRLTDGQGDTVHFSETVLVFTSNLGVVARGDDGRRQRTVGLDDSYDVIDHRIRTAIEEFFTYELGRPELLTRIGDNIVVFDFIRPDVAPAIFDALVRNVAGRVADVHGIEFELSVEARETLLGWCTAELDKGARGIAAAIEGNLVNPLARELFDHAPPEGSRVVVLGAHRSHLGVELELDRP
jgi:ATP-dependent Clp protease ATP-binding subunit ClpB